MIGIIEKRRKSIRSRLIIDLGFVLIGCCIFNYILVSFIYANLLNREELAKSEIVANAAITHAEQFVKNSDSIMKNITKIAVLQDSQMTLEDKIKRFEGYASPFYDISIVEPDGKGMDSDYISFDLKGTKVFEDVLRGEYKTFDILSDGRNCYIVLLRPVKDSEGQLQSIAMGIHRIEDFFEEIRQISSGEVCFLANGYGEVIAAISDGNEAVKVESIYNDQKIKELFKKGIIYGKEYNRELKDELLKTQFNLNYKMINDSQWLLGVINNRNGNLANLKEFKTAMFLGTIIVISLGLIVIYFSANSISKKMQEIANYLGDTIENEFKDPVPMKLLQHEDEIGNIAREIKHLEDEMSEMLQSIKESINYLNDKENFIS